MIFFILHKGWALIQIPDMALAMYSYLKKRYLNVENIEAIKPFSLKGAEIGNRVTNDQEFPNCLLIANTVRGDELRTSLINAINNLTKQTNKLDAKIEELARMQNKSI